QTRTETSRGGATPPPRPPRSGRDRPRAPAHSPRAAAYLGAHSLFDVSRPEDVTPRRGARSPQGRGLAAACPEAIRLERSVSDGGRRPSRRDGERDRRRAAAWPRLAPKRYASSALAPA